MSGPRANNRYSIGRPRKDHLGTYRVKHPVMHHSISKGCQKLFWIILIHIRFLTRLLSDAAYLEELDEHLRWQSASLNLGR